MSPPAQSTTRILSASETLTQDALCRLQKKRLSWTLRRARKTHLYRNRLPEGLQDPARDEISLDELVGELPITTKQQLRAQEHLEDVLAVPATAVQRWHCSSGTSGVRTATAYTKRDLQLWAELTARALFAAGVYRGTRIHNAYGYGLFTGGLGFEGGLRKLGAMVVPASSHPSPREHLELMAWFRAELLLCTPSCAATLVETLLDLKWDVKHLNLRAGIFGGEAWSESLRQRIESGLNLKAYNTYGLSEIIGPGVAHECPVQQGLHLYEDAFLAEVLTIGGFERVAANMAGELILTTLANEACPRIRYRTGDVVRVDFKPCACGRTTMRIREVLGRVQDAIDMDGIPVMPMQLEKFLLGIPELTSSYQIHLSRDETAPPIIFVEGQRGMEKTERKTLARMVERQLAKAFSVTPVAVCVEPAGRLPRSQGKSTRIVYKNHSEQGMLPK
jgi:phenylacetate-CoA ligase